MPKEDLKNYRQSFLLKLVERVVAAQIGSHIDSNDLGNTFQSAYKAGHSTEIALLCIQNEIYLSLSKGMPMALLLLDLSADFNTINHDTLLTCLSTRFGFTGTVLRWFTTYLPDRFQSVKIGSVISECFKLNFGLPQVSENKLKLNPGKTEFIIFGSMDKYKLLKDSFPVNILGKCLSPKDVVRNLGVLFDSKFSFTNHVNTVIKSCYANLRYLHHIQRFLSYDVSLMVANTLISNRLYYCNSLFCSLSSKNIIRLQNIQNCLARFVSGASRFSHVSPILKSLHWLPVKQ